MIDHKKPMLLVYDSRYNSAANYKGIGIKRKKEKIQKSYTLPYWFFFCESCRVIRTNLISNFAQTRVPFLSPNKVLLVSFVCITG